MARVRSEEAAVFYSDPKRDSPDNQSDVLTLHNKCVAIASKFCRLVASYFESLFQLTVLFVNDLLESSNIPILLRYFLMKFISRFVRLSNRKLSLASAFNSPGLVRVQNVEDHLKSVVLFPAHF